MGVTVSTRKTRWENSLLQPQMHPDIDLDLLTASELCETFFLSGHCTRSRRGIGQSSLESEVREQRTHSLRSCATTAVCAVRRVQKPPTRMTWATGFDKDSCMHVSDTIHSFRHTGVYLRREDKIQDGSGLQGSIISSSIDQ